MSLRLASVLRYKILYHAWFLIATCPTKHKRGELLTETFSYHYTNIGVSNGALKPWAHGAQPISFITRKIPTEQSVGIRYWVRY